MPKTTKTPKLSPCRNEKTRAEREAIVLDQLDEIRVIAPEEYENLMALLAKMSAKHEPKAVRS